LHSGVLTAGTTAQNPAANQIQVAEDTGVADWTLYMSGQVGGSLALAARLVIGNGNDAWIVSNQGLPAHQVGLSNPAGPISSGDSYDIVAFPDTTIVAAPLDSDIELEIEQMNVTFTYETMPGQLFMDEVACTYVPAAEVLFATNCAITEGVFGQNCNVSQGFLFTGVGYGNTLYLDGNCWVQSIGSGVDFGACALQIGDNNPNGGQNLGFQTLIIGPSQALVANSPDGSGLLVLAGGLVSLNSSLWSWNLNQYGVLVGPSGRVVMQHASNYGEPVVPTATGGAGDFAFIDIDRSVVAEYSFFTASTGLYSTPVAASWASAFSNDTPGNAQWPATMAGIVAYGLAPPS
jgi:hypothetical protein